MAEPKEQIATKRVFVSGANKYSTMLCDMSCTDLCSVDQSPTKPHTPHLLEAVFRLHCNVLSIRSDRDWTCSDDFSSPESHATQRLPYTALWPGHGLVPPFRGLKQVCVPKIELQFSGHFRKLSFFPDEIFSDERVLKQWPGEVVGEAGCLRLPVLRRTGILRWQSALRGAGGWGGGVAWISATGAGASSSAMVLDSAFTVVLRRPDSGASLPLFSHYPPAPFGALVPVHFVPRAVDFSGGVSPSRVFSAYLLPHCSRLYVPPPRSVRHSSPRLCTGFGQQRKKLGLHWERNCAELN